MDMESNWMCSLDRQLELLLPRFSLFTWCVTAPDGSSIELLEQRIGWSLPEIYRSFLARYGAMLVEPRPASLIATGREPDLVEDSRLAGFYVFGASRGLPDFLSLERAVAEIRAAGELPLLPFFKRLYSSQLFGFTRHGRVASWSFERRHIVEIADADFNELLLTAARDLARPDDTAARDAREREGGVAQ